RIGGRRRRSQGPDASRNRGGRAPRLDRPEGHSHPARYHIVCHRPGTSSCPGLLGTVPGATLLFDMSLEFVAEMLEPASERGHCAGCKIAECVARAEESDVVGKRRKILGLALARLNRRQD